MTLDFNTDELRAINNALNEVLHGPDAIEDPEFETRMGVTRAEAEQMLERIHHACEKMKA